MIPTGISRANASKNCSGRQRGLALFGSFVRCREGSILLPVGEFAFSYSGLSTRLWHHFGTLSRRSADETKRMMAVSYASKGEPRVSCLATLVGIVLRKMTESRPIAVGLGFEEVAAVNLRNLSIMFVGSKEVGEMLEAAAQRFGVHLWSATEVLQALAFYTFYMPDAVLLEDGPSRDLTNEVYFHLSSVNAKPLIILSGESESEAWKDVSDETTLVIPRSTNGESLLATIAETTSRTPSWFRSQGAGDEPEGGTDIGKNLGVPLTSCSSNETGDSRYSRSHGSPSLGTVLSSPSPSAGGE